MPLCPIDSISTEREVGTLALVSRSSLPRAKSKNLPPEKNRPPSLTGAKLPWFSRVARALLAANGGVAAGADWSLRGGGYAASYGRSAPVEDAIPWGDVVPWAAKLFSINLICTLLTIFCLGAGVV
jgi:hypothetical protein